MDDWKQIEFCFFSKIEKCVAEFHIIDGLQKTPYGKFKVKIFEGVNGEYSGVTDIAVRDIEGGNLRNGSGRGSSVADTLEKTLISFSALLSERKEWKDSDFDWLQPEEF